MKKLFKISLVLLLLLVLLFVGLVLMIDSLAKTGVEKAGTHALGVPTHAEKVDLSVFKGRVDLEGIVIENPQGFGERDFFALQSAGFQADLQSLRGDTVRVPEFRISGVDVSLVRNDRGTNYGSILDNLKRFESKPAGESAPSESGGPQKKFVIDSILIENVRAHADLQMLGQQIPPVTVDVPRIEIKNFGTAEGAQSVSDLFSRVIREVLDAVMEQGQGLLPTELLGDLQGRLADLEGVAAGLTEGLRERAGDTIDQLGDEVSERLEGLREGAGDVLEGVVPENVGEDIEKAADDLGKKAGEALDGLLGGKKKKKKDE